MPITKSDIAEFASKTKGAPSAQEILGTWDSSCKFLESYMRQGKGVLFPDFGTFAYQVDKLNLGNTGSLNKRIPTFKVNAQFSASNGVSGKTNIMDTDNVSHNLLNFASVAAYNNQHREQANQAYKLFIIALGQAIHQGQGVTLDCHVGTFHVPPGSNWGTMNFKRQFYLDGFDVVPQTQQIPKNQTTRAIDNPLREMREDYHIKEGEDPSQIYDETNRQENQIFWKGREVVTHIKDGQPSSKERGGIMGTGPTGHKVSPARRHGIGDAGGKASTKKEGGSGSVEGGQKNPYDMPRLGNPSSRQLSDMAWRDMTMGDLNKGQAVKQAIYTTVSPISGKGSFNVNSLNPEQQYTGPQQQQNPSELSPAAQRKQTNAVNTDASTRNALGGTTPLLPSYDFPAGMSVGAKAARDMIGTDMQKRTEKQHELYNSIEHQTRDRRGTILNPSDRSGNVNAGSTGGTAYQYTNYQGSTAMSQTLGATKNWGRITKPRALSEQKRRPKNGLNSILKTQEIVESPKRDPLHDWYNSEYQSNYNTIQNMQNQYQEQQAELREYQGLRNSQADKSRDFYMSRNGGLGNLGEQGQRGTGNPAELEKLNITKNIKHTARGTDPGKAGSGQTTDKDDSPEDDGWRGGRGYDGINPQLYETYGQSLYHTGGNTNKSKKRSSTGTNEDNRLPKIHPASQAGRDESVDRLAQTLPSISSKTSPQSNRDVQQQDLNLTGEQSKIWLRPTYTETKHTQLTNRDPVFLTQVASRAYQPGSTYNTTTTGPAHASEVAKLREFNGSQSLRAVPGMDPQFCRVCHRWSEILPAPNMCSQCIQRGILIRDRAKREEYEAYDQYETQAYHQRRDEEDLEEDRQAGLAARAARALADEKNVELIAERDRTYQLHKDDDAIIGGKVKLNDVFNYRADDTFLTPEQKLEFGRKLQQQIDDDFDKKRRFKESELEIGRQMDERDNKIAREQAERDLKKKYDMQEEQRLGLEAQLSEEEEARKYRMPRLLGYNRDNRNRAGEMVDPFTNQYEPSNEERQQVKDNLKRELQMQIDERGIKERDALEKQKADERTTSEMQRDAFEKECDEINREYQDAREKQKQAYEKQMAERVIPSYTYGYDDPDGDRFTRGLTPTEIHTRKIGDQNNLDQILRRQIEADNAKRDQERAEFLQDAADTIAHDEYEKDCDRKSKEAHDAYALTNRDDLVRQIDQQNKAKLADRDQWKTISNTTLSPQIGRDDVRVDCEKPYYRVKLVTKKRRMIDGF